MNSILQKKSVCLALCILIFPLSSYSVEPLFDTPSDMEPTIIDRVLDVFGADAGFNDKEKIDMSYIPTAYYTPEKQFGVGLLFVGLYQTEQNTPLSSLIINTFASMNQSYGVTLESLHYFDQGKQRLDIELELHNEAAVYYGIGIEAGENYQNKHDYDEQLVSFKPTYKRQVDDNFFIGVGAEITNVSADNINSDYINTPAILPSDTSAGLRVNSSYDSRDYHLNPTDGWLVEIEAGLFHRSDNDNQYSKYGVELSNYIDLSPAPGLIAWQIQGQFSSGDVPWYALSDIGGSKAMRGYIRGRYRDKQMVMGQLEYRLPIFQRYGMVFWGGVGSVASQMSELNNDLLTSVGMGFRVKIKDRVNLRADIGQGEHETHFYLNVKEAF